MSEPRQCLCGCGASLDGRRGNARYIDPRHRQRAYRKRLITEAEAKGISATLTMRSVRAATPTRKRHGDARRASRGPDLRISYRKAVEAVATILAGDDADEMWLDFARMDSERILRPLLTERQRAAVEERGAK